MGCDIVFMVNGERVTLAKTNLQADSSLEAISLYLSNDPEFRKRLYSKFKGLKQVFDVDLTQYTTGLTNNYTVEKLLNRYPYMNWPEKQLGLPILAINSYVIKDNYGKTITGPRILTNGTILININNDTDVKAINSYILIKDLIENMDVNTQSILDEYLYILEPFIKRKEELNKLKQKLDKTENESTKKSLSKNPFELLDVDNDVANILLHYLTNSDKYRGLYADGKTFEYILNNLYKLLLNIVDHEYNDSFTNLINRKIDKKNKTISLKDLQEIVTASENYKEKGKILTNPKVSKEEKLEFCKELFSDTSIDFSYSPKEITGNKLLLTYFSGTFSEKYGDEIFNLRTMKDLTPILINGKYNYKGYHIYKWGEYGYIYSKGIITEYSYGTNLYESVDEVLRLLDKKSISDTDSFYAIHLNQGNVVYTPYKYTPGTILEILDSRPLELKSITYDKETLNLFYNISTSLNKINNYLKRVYGIKEETFDSKEKALLFLHYKLQNPKISITEAVDKINSLKNRYIYIEKSDFTSTKNWIPYIKKSERELSHVRKNQQVDVPMCLTRIFDIDLDRDIDLYKPRYNGSQTLIVENILKNLVEIMKEKFQIPIEILTLSEIEDLFNDVDLNAKAFIRNGIIYINSSAANSEDVFHEYSHIFLGVLKATNYDLYEQLMSTIEKDKGVLNIIEFKLNDYPNLARQDILEEIFSQRFGTWLANRPGGLSLTLEKGFSKAQKEIEKGMSSIFNKGVEGKDMFNDSIFKIISKFTENIYLLMNESNGDIKMQLSESAKYRLASNWISELLKSGELLEDC